MIVLYNHITIQGKIASTNSKEKLSRESLEKIAESFRVFSEATRLTILQELKAGPRSVDDLVAAVGSSLANVSKQLRILFEASFVKREKAGMQVFYSICAEIVLPMCELVCGKLNRDAVASLVVLRTPGEGRHPAAR